MQGLSRLSERTPPCTRSGQVLQHDTGCPYHVESRCVQSSLPAVHGLGTMDTRRVEITMMETTSPPDSAAYQAA
jgi:hypothetical protein